MMGVYVFVWAICSSFYTFLCFKERIATLEVYVKGFFLQLQGLFLLQTRLVLSEVHAADTGITYRYF